MRLFRDIPRMLLGVKALRRCLSVFMLALADGAALALGQIGAAYLFGGVALDEIERLAPLLLAAWISVFAALRLYERAPSGYRRSSSP